MEFRDAVKYLRTELCLTQMELANALHISFATVGRWENGRNLPTRSITAALLDFARSRAVSAQCMESLTQAVANATKERLSQFSDGLYPIEHASLGQLIDDASYPIYVCDIETDEILYLNRKAYEMAGGEEPAVGRLCYERLMHRSTACEFCHKKELLEDRFTCYEATRPFDNATYRVQGKRIRWNGREAHVRYINEADSGSQLKGIIDNMNGGVSVAVFGVDGDVRLAYANERYYTLFGYTKEQFVAELKGAHDTLHPEDAEHVGAAIAEVKSTGRAATFRYRIIKRDGSVAFIRCSSSMSAIRGLGDKVLISVLTDITESVEAEQQTLVLGYRLDAIMKNISNAVTAVIIEDDGTVEFLFSNELYHEMLGYTREQYHSEVSDPFRLVYPEDADAVRSAVTGTGQVGDSRVLQYRVVCRDGKLKWLRARLSVMSFPDQDRPVQLAVYADITDMVEANEQLAAQRDRISEMVNAAPSGIAVIEADPRDVEGSQRTLYYNDRFFSFSGYSQNEYEALLRRDQLYFAYDEDIPALRAFTARICAGDIGNSEDIPVRCHTKDGGYRWLLLTGLLVEKHGERCIISVSQVDITERKKAIDRQRISEEMLRIAAENDKRALITYDVKSNVCQVESRTLYAGHYGETLADIPQTLIDRGIVAEDAADVLRSMFERIRSGEERVTVSLQLNTGEGEYQWYECNATTVFDEDGKPDHAVLVLHNITEQRIKEAVFKKWQHSIEARSAASYTLFRCNMSRGADLDERKGELLKIEFSDETRSFNARTREYADRYVCAEDIEGYCELMNSDSLLSSFYRGDHTHVLDYREVCADGALRWRRLTAELVESMNSTDVLAFLMYEDIDEEKRSELKERELAETDPLTGALNRVIFSERADSVITRELSMQHALLMVEIDGIQQVNEAFGHSAGDQALIDATAAIRSLTRDGDHICRLEGGKFLVLLRDMPYDAVVEKKAGQMCGLLGKSYSREVQTRASIGIAVYPRDGRDFDELYHNADKALHTVRTVGVEHYAFYSAGVESAPEEGAEERDGSGASPVGALRRRMLIVDDSEVNRLALKGWFQKEYLIETASNGEKALTKLRHFGSAISIVLLDLSMPGMDGYEVLQRMQNNIDLRTIPVIVVSGDDEYDSTLRAIECGAADFVTKPVEPKLIRLRVQSAVSKAENERLRAQNSYLQLQRDEEMKFRTVLESTGTVVVEYDWHNKVFLYDRNITEYIAGDYSANRSLWQAFLADMVAESADVKYVQEAMLFLANNREKSKSNKLIMLKTPGGAKHWFRVCIYKQTDDFGLADKMILTFNDVHDEVLADEKLRYQATRDELTGLYNRSGFIEKATELIAAKSPGYYMLSCVDIERFRVINDQYGTAKGDEVLRRVASVLSTFHGVGKDFCCRISGDNFALLYPAGAAETPELIHTQLAEGTADSSLPQLKFTIGRCLVDDKSLGVSAIYDRAYLAKDSIKGRYDVFVATYDETMRTDLLRQQRITSQMNSALVNGQFEVWLQPQYNHATGALTGAEALVRWRHPEDGLIPPNEFIPIFERNGFVYEIDKFVWESCCALLRRWLDAGLEPVPISVNISRYDIFREDIVYALTGLIAKYELPVELLRLEVTESAFAQSAEQIISVVRRLIDLGFTVEIDDFGSGYSSLNTLKDVPAQVLKMDMRFFENTSDSARGGNIVESVVRMSRWLGMSVIAEGVEVLEQADYLQSIGCDTIQGYLYSKPLPQREYEALLTGSRKESELSRMRTLETWNNNAFWDPKSMESLIFNSYVGGACIFEYRNGRSELLRANAAFGRELGGLLSESDRLSKDDFTDLLDKENRAILQAAARTAAEEMKESSCELVMTRYGQTEYLRVTLRLIASAADSLLYYVVIQNMTEQRVAEQKQSESARRLEMIMSSINGGVSAIYLREGRPEYVIVNDQYYALLGYTREQFDAEVHDAFEIVHPDDRERIRAEVRESLKSQGRYTMEYRVVCRDKSIRHILCTTSVIRLSGVDEPVQLSVINDVTAEMEAKEQLRFLNDSARDILAQPDSGKAIQDALGKLMSYFAADRGYVVELDNAAMLSTNTYEVCADGVSSEKEKLSAVAFTRSDYWYSALSNGEYFVVEDIDRLDGSEAALRELLASQGIRSLILAPLLRDGALIGFVGVDNPGKAIDQVDRLTAMGDYIAILLTRRDMRRRLRAAETRLLDNLPHGAALYEYDGEGLTVIHLNRRYWQLVEREPVDYGSLSVFDAIHPDDVSVTVQEIKAAVRQGRNASLDIRVRHGADGYMPFHVSANIEKEANGKYLLYVSYTPISEQTMSLQELLPIALSAIMASSPDMSYIKDKQLRYICASPSAVQTAGCVSERDMIGRTDFELFGAALGEKYLADDTSVMETGRPLVNDHDLMLAANGEPHDIMTSKFPILDAKGEVIGLYGVSRDVTELRKAESELKLLSDSIPGGILSFELGPEGLSALYFNEGFFRVSGYTREEYSALTENDPLALVHEDDRQKLTEIVEEQLQNKDMDVTVQRDIRCRLHDGSYRWFTMRERGTVAARDRIIINAVLFDIDERKRAEEQLRVSEEEYRLAAEMGDNVICRYSIADSTVTIPADIARRSGLPELLEDVPYGRVRLGRISPDTADDYIRFFESIRSGEKEGSVTYRKLLSKGWRWFSSKFKTVFGDDEKPVSAVVAFADVTEQREKELAFAKWRQMLLERPEDSYTLFTCDIENVGGFDSREGRLLDVVFAPEAATFDARTAQYVRQYVYEDDREQFSHMMSVGRLMEKYRAGTHNSTMEFREKLPSGGCRWLRLTVDLMRSPTSDAVEGHLLFEDIDEQKRAELLTKERSEKDPLTGVLNRTAFISRMEDILSKAKEGEQHV